MRCVLYRRGAKWVAPTRAARPQARRFAKIGLVGAGGVGGNIAHLAAIADMAGKIALIGIVPGLAAATALGLNHAAGITGARVLCVGGEDLGLVAAQVKTLAQLLKQRGLMLATAESCTGGGIAEVLTRIAGSSDWFECGFVTYSNESKQAMLDVQPHTLDKHGAVSEAVVEEMTAGAIARSAAQLAVAVSGVAGPGGGSDDKPVGTVWLAWQLQGLSTSSRCYHFQGDREAVRCQAISVALGGLIELLASASVACQT